MIRDGVPGDVPALLRMARDFAAVAGHGLPWDAAYAEAGLRAHVGGAGRYTGVAVVDGAARGMLLAAAHPSPIGPAKVASELAFWIDPAHRGRWGLKMVRAYRAWAVRQGCALVGMAALDDRTGALYRRAGFEPAERHYRAVI